MTDSRMHTVTELLTVDEVAGILKVSAKTIRRRIAAGEIRVMRVGTPDRTRPVLSINSKG